MPAAKLGAEKSPAGFCRKRGWSSHRDYRSATTLHRVVLFVAECVQLVLISLSFCVAHRDLQMDRNFLILRGGSLTPCKQQ